MGENRERAIKEHVLRSHGQSQSGYVQGWEAGMGGVWRHGGVKMETTELEQQ